jgi:type III pantothenate kinase
MIGNSRLHWAWFEAETLYSCDTAHLSVAQIACLTTQLDFTACGLDWPEITPPPALPLWLASVVPAQTALWQAYPETQVITLDQVPLAGLYPTLGIDRALALLGAVKGYGAPCLVIDAGTALTFTGADAQSQLIGGAILPGLRLQLRALGDHTAALPQLITHPPNLPSRWSRSTSDAILSGVLHSLLAGLRDFVAAWQLQHPDSAILITGGDAALLINLLAQQAPELAAQIRLDLQLVFQGMQQIAKS